MTAAVDDDRAFLKQLRTNSTDKHREELFQRSLERTANYFDAIRANGNLPWFAVGHPRRDEVITRLGLPEDISEEDLRRAFFLARYE